MAAKDQIPTVAQVLPANLNKVSIQSTAFPNVYLRSDATNHLINLQVGRSGWERHELIKQPEAEYGPNVFIIRSVKFPEYYLHLDPTVSPEQAPNSQSPVSQKMLTPCCSSPVKCTAAHL